MLHPLAFLFNSPLHYPLFPSPSSLLPYPLLPSFSSHHGQVGWHSGIPVGHFTPRQTRNFSKNRTSSDSLAPAHPKYFIDIKKCKFFLVVFCFFFGEETGELFGKYFSENGISELFWCFHEIILLKFLLKILRNSKQFFF
jgi:hypothetical protein